MRKRPLSPFSLAFLDIMFCGFGAVVLLVMILNGEVLRKREARSEDLRGELARVTSLEEFARQHLVEIKSKIEEAELEEGELEGRVRKIQEILKETRVSSTAAKQKALELKTASEKLRREKAALEESARLLTSKKPETAKSGNRLVGFTGDGQRQYLTGLKLGGERTLILLDTSASMLDETIVNIIRRKLMPADLRRQAPKWQRVIRTVHWLISNLREGTKFQVYSFSTTADSVVAGTAGRWLDASNPADLQAALKSTLALAPANGTSLHRAFRSVSSLRPAPDSVILLTDGLPTQGFSTARPGMISGEERQALFDNAVTVLPKTVPVNTLLFPIEGDPSAAAAFWKLAITSRGSFITPSRDWP